MPSGLELNSDRIFIFSDSSDLLIELINHAIDLRNQYILSLLNLLIAGSLKDFIFRHRSGLPLYSPAGLMPGGRGKPLVPGDQSR